MDGNPSQEGFRYYSKAPFLFPDCTDGFEPGVQSTSGNFFSNPLPAEKTPRVMEKEKPFQRWIRLGIAGGF